MILTFSIEAFFIPLYPVGFGCQQTIFFSLHAMLDLYFFSSNGDGSSDYVIDSTIDTDYEPRNKTK